MATALVDTGTDLDPLIASWQRHLRAENKSSATVTAYSYAATGLRDFALERGMPTRVSGISREHVESYLADLLERRSPATANNRYRGLVAFFGWLRDEGEISASPMANLRPPRIPEAPVPVPRLEDVRAMIDGCDPSTLEGRRDAAILRLFVDAGLRLSELAGLRLDGPDGPDGDLDSGLVRVLGKGSRIRFASFGAKTAKAVDRYLRRRSTHPEAARPELWLGLKGPMTGSGIRQMVWRRSEAAGIARLHPHQLRHLFAHEWLANGGQESDLMSLAGWRSRAMVTRYASSTRAERARLAHRAFGLGDRL